MGYFFDRHNNTDNHTGQGMDGKPPAQVMAENPYERREIPANYKKYLFALCHVKTVQRNGILLDGGWYYTPKMKAIIGQRVEVRCGLDDAGTVHIFSLPHKRDKVSDTTTMRREARSLTPHHEVSGKVSGTTA